MQVYQVTQTKEKVITVDAGFGPERIPHRGSDLSVEFEVVVPQEGLEPKSRIGMIQQADKMLQMGLIQSPAQYIRIAELPGSEELIAGISPQIAKAKRENSELARGEVGNPEWHKDDDHNIHIEEHRAFMSTKRWEMLAPPIQELFTNHVQMHKNFQAEGQAKDIQMAGAQSMAEQAVAPVPEMGQEGLVAPPNQQLPPMPPPQGGQGGPIMQGMEGATEQTPIEDQMGAMLGQL